MNADPPPGCNIKLPKEEDIFLWEVTMDAPTDSIYHVRTNA